MTAEKEDFFLSVDAEQSTLFSDTEVSSNRRTQYREGGEENSSDCVGISVSTNDSTNEIIGVSQTKELQSSTLKKKSFSMSNRFGSIFRLGGNDKQLDPSNIEAIETPLDAISSLKYALEQKDEMFAINITNAVLLLISNSKREHLITFSEAGGIKIIEQIMMTYMIHEIICENCLRMIHHIISIIYNISKYSSTQSLSNLYQIFKSYIQNKKIVEQIMICLFYFSEDEFYLSIMITHGCCKIVTSALKIFNDSDIVIEYGCRCIYNLTYDTSLGNEVEEKLALDDDVLCETLAVSIILEKNKFMNLGAAYWSLQAIGCIARRNHDNKQMLANLGGCEGIMKLVKRFDTKQCNKLVEGACWAIGNLAYPDEGNQTRLQQIGACEFLLESLDHHVGDGRVLQEIFRAIRNLTLDHETNTRIFIEGNVCEKIVETVRIFLLDRRIASTNSRISMTSFFSTISSIAIPKENRNADTKNTTGDVKSSSVDMNIMMATVQWGWYVIAALADDSQALGRFHNTGVREILKETLEKYGDSSDVAQWSLHALGKLATHDEDSKAQLGQMLRSVVVKVMNNHIKDADVIEESLSALGNIIELDINQSAYADTNLPTILKTVIKTHMKSEDVIVQASNVIVGLCRNHHENIIQKLNSASLCSSVPAVLLKYPENELLALQLCKACIDLATFESSSAKLGSHGVIGAIVSVMTTHIRNVNVLQEGLTALGKLFNCEQNAKRMRSDGACPVVVNALAAAAGFGIKDLVKLSFQLLMQFCSDENCRGAFALDMSSAGVSEVVVSTSLLLVDDPEIALLGCMAIGCLCGMTSKDFNATLESYDETDKAKDTSKTQKPASSNTTRRKIRLPAKLTRPVARQNESTVSLVTHLGDVGACALIEVIMRKHMDQEELAVAACLAIDSLASEAVNRPKLMQAGCCTIIVDVLGKYIHNPAVVTASSLAIGSLSKNDQFHSIQAVFGTTGCLTLFTEALQTYEESSIVCAAVCRAIAQTSRDHAINKRIFFNGQCSKVLVSSLKRHLHDDIATKQAINAIGRLAHDFPECEESFGSENVCFYIAAALKANMARPAHVIACCGAIVGLKSLNVQLREAGLCEQVMIILYDHINNASVCHSACNAIESLAEDETNKYLLIENMACEKICAAAQKHVGNESLFAVMLMRDTSSADVALSACNAMYCLAISNKSFVECQKRLGAAGACEVIAKCITKYAEIEAVSVAIFKAICILASNHDGHKTKLGMLGACTSIVEALHVFPSSVEIAKWGCRAIAAMAEKHDGNVSKFAVAGACETLPVVMQAHQTIASVGGAGADAVAAMAEGEQMVHASRLGRSGACEAIVTALKNHMTESAVIERACKAVASLAKERGNTAWFGATGCCESLLAAQGSHMLSAGVTAAVWTAVANLSDDETNRVRFAEYGACEMVVETFATHITVKEVAWACSFAIEQLCENRAKKSVRKGSLVKPSDESSLPPVDWTPAAKSSALGKAREVARKVLNIIHQHPSNVRSIVTPEVEALLEMKILGQMHKSIDKSVLPSITTERGRFFFSGCCEVLSVAIRLHMDADAPTCNLLRVIGRLAKTKTDALNAERIVFGLVGTCSAVVATLLRHPDSEKIAYWGCKSLAVLIQSSQYNRDAVTDAGGCDAVVHALRHHRHTESGINIATVAANTIYGLAIESIPNKAALGKAGACNGILEALELHVKVESVVEACSVALEELCRMCDVNRATVCFSGAADIIVIAMNKYAENQVIITSLLKTMIIMCTLRVGRHKLGSAGISRVVTLILSRVDMTEQSSLACLCCTLISAMAYRNADNQQKLGQLGACKLLTSMIEKRSSEEFGNAISSDFQSTKFLSVASAALSPIANMGPTVLGNFRSSPPPAPLNNLSESSRISSSFNPQNASQDNETTLSPSTSNESLAESAVKRLNRDSASIDAVSDGDLNWNESSHGTNEKDYDWEILKPDFDLNTPSSLLRESLRALGCLIKENDGNKTKAIHANALELLTKIRTEIDCDADQTWRSSEGEQLSSSGQMKVLVHEVLSLLQ